MKKIIKLKNKYGMFVCVLVCLICFCFGCGQEEETVFLEQKEELSEEAEKTNEAEETEKSKTKESEKSEESEIEVQEKQSAVQGQICVFVCGFVKNPGVYYLNENARLYEAIESAGGFLEEADTGWLNQAEILSDGDKVRIYSKEETQKMQEAGIKEESGTAEKSVETNRQNQQNQTQDAGKVNINTASAEELQTVPGIGAAKAAAIIEYREAEGEFKSTEEIQNVPGIKGKTFEKIQPYLTAG